MYNDVPIAIAIDVLREALHVKKVAKLWTFSVRGGAQPHSIALGGVFPHYRGDSNRTKLTIKRQI